MRVDELDTTETVMTTRAPRSLQMSVSNLDNDGDTQVLSRIEEPFVMWRKVFKHTRFYFFIVFVIFKLDRDEHNVVQLPWFNF